MGLELYLGIRVHFMKRKQTGFQTITVFTLLLLTTFLILPQDLILHQKTPSSASEEVVCCGECHPSSCCKLKRQVEVMSACCSIGFHPDIATSPKITVEEFVDGIIFHSIPPAKLPIRHVNTFDIYSSDVLVPPPRQLIEGSENSHFI